MVEGVKWDGVIPDSKSPKHLLFFNLLPLFTWWNKDYSSHPYLICMTAALSDAKSYLSLALPKIVSLLHRPEQVAANPILGGVLKRLHLFMRLDLAFNQWLSKGGRDHPSEQKAFIISESYQLNVSSSGLALSLINQANQNKKDLQQLNTRKGDRFSNKQPFNKGGGGRLPNYKRSNNFNNKNTSQKNVVCWSCSGRGHTKSNCPKSKQSVSGHGSQPQNPRPK